MIKIKYPACIADLIQYNNYVFWRDINKSYLYGIPLGTIVYFVTLRAQRTEMTIKSYIICMLGFIFLIFLFAYTVNFFSRFYLRFQYKKGVYQMHSGDFEVLLTEQSLEFKGEKFNSSFKISAIQKVIQWRNYYFLEVSRREAFCLPIEKIAEGDIDFFIEKLPVRKHIKSKGLKLLATTRQD